MLVDAGSNLQRIFTDPSGEGEAVKQPAGKLSVAKEAPIHFFA